MTKVLAPKKTSNSEADASHEVFIEVVQILSTYATKHKARVVGFNEDFTEAVFVRLETGEALRVPYTQVKQEVAEYEETN